MYFDLHNHSEHSRDAQDSIEKIVLNGIECGLDCVGISDHNYWITGHFDDELNEINDVRAKYSDKINVLRGMEVSFLRPDGIDPKTLDGYDYVLLEYFVQAGVDFERVCKFADLFPCRVGLAHIDIFEYSEKNNVDALAMMAKHDIFWELNVNFDTIHAHREHEYCKRFKTDSAQQNRIKELGIELSVGFDTHALYDYDSERVKSMCDFIDSCGFNVPSFVRKIGG